MHAGTKLGDTMRVAMPPEDAKRWFGTAPPDLSVIARARGGDWLYTYLRSFYLDDDRSTGVNNAVFKDVAMPHVLWELQGLRKPVYARDADGSSVIERFETVTPGSLSEAEYDAFVRDLVTYLAYMGEPAKMTRIRLAPWALAFLALFFVVLYLLKKEIWKDVR
jgi:ubiquinol-cytochrome c reductase cytochrome c1 subunit